MKTKFSIQATGFPGFYESVLLNSDSDYWEIEYEINEIHEEFPKFSISHDDFDFNYREYVNDVSSSWAQAYAELFPKEIVVSSDFDTVIPPRNTGYGPDYRFGTDRLFINVELADDWFDQMCKFINERRDWFAARIKQDWSSYDGFCSFMANDIDGWIEGLKEEDERYIGETIGYMMQIKHDNLAEDINFVVMEDIYIGGYISMTEEKAAELEEYRLQAERDEMAKEWEREHQLKLDLDFGDGQA